MSEDLAPRRDVLLVPWGRSAPGGARRAAGLFDAEGRFLPEGICLRWEDHPLTVEPDFDRDTAPAEVYEGRWLFGGLLYHHFGHFLCESTARLWAFDHLGGQRLRGVVWFPKPRRTHAGKLAKPFRPLFEALGLRKLKLLAPQAPVRIEELVIPEQGFGIGALAAGRPQYRAFMRDRLCARIAPEGGPRLYVSRSRLPFRIGSVLNEGAIEARLAAEGYEIFHPEAHPIPVQIARYRAARRIVGLDGSALHLAAMVAAPETEVAIINRGPSQNIADYALQFRHFAGIEPVCIEAVAAWWSRAGERVVRRAVHALLDLPRLGAALAGAGFVSSGDWPATPEAEVAEALAAREARLGHALARRGGGRRARRRKAEEAAA